MDFLLQPSNNPHHAPGFVNPPIDGSLCVPEIYDWHYENNPTHTVFLYEDQPGNLVRVTYSNMVPAMHNAARVVAKKTHIDLGASAAPHTIAILASSDTISYFTTALGLWRAGVVIFLISPRNSVAAVTHLLSKVRPSHLLISTEDSIQDLARSAVRDLAEDAAPGILFMPTFDEIYLPNSPHVPLPPRLHDLSVDRVIMHSSGTTSFPKPIPWNDRQSLQVAAIPQFGAQNLCGKVIACHSIATFHAIGIAVTFWMAVSGFTIGTFAPASPAQVPTPDAVWAGAVAVSPAFFWASPIFFEGWMRDPAKLAFLKQLQGIIYGGAPLQKVAGDFLASNGVNIHTLYGSTEVGAYAVVLPNSPKLDWEYVTWNPHVDMSFVPLGDGTYELIVIGGPTTELPQVVVNTTFNGHKAHATNDVLLPHPTLPNRWKVVGRLDDQIMLSTGEKTNPGPLEAIICRHPHIASAVMFGRGRFQNGIIIEVKPAYAFDPSDPVKFNAFIADIWPYVKEMNAYAPGHSRLFKEMIIVAHPSRPFSYNHKGAPKRVAILAEYADDIEAIYTEVEKGVRITPPAEWTPDTTLDFVRETVNGVLRQPASDSDDLFEWGCDSLQAMWIRQSFVHALGPVISAKMSSGFVYEHPTIESLAKHMLAFHTQSSEGESSISDAESFLDLYTRNFPTHTPNASAVIKSGSEGDVVLVTGTTGALGSALLATLVASKSVAKVYALNRPSKQGGSVSERQEKGLVSRGYSAEVVRSPKVVLVEGETTKAGVKVDEKVLDEMRRSVTHIIHNAWRVDFNLSTASFENAIGGTRALVDLALSSPRAAPPRFLFTSSVGVFRNHDSDVPFPEIPIDDPKMPMGQGYSESKWVAERILTEASKTTPLQPVVVRIGQLSGGLNGSWNTSDWVPLIIKSSLKMGILPDLKGICSWIPLDFAARVLVELASSTPKAQTAHLTHPQTVPCHDVFKVFSEELSLPLQPLDQWVKVLEEMAQVNVDSGDRKASNQLLDALPAAKTLDFYKGSAQLEVDSREAMGVANLDLTQALTASRTLREEGSAQKIGPKDVRSWLEYWRSVGFI